MSITCTGTSSTKWPGASANCAGYGNCCKCNDTGDEASCKSQMPCCAENNYTKQKSPVCESGKCYCADDKKSQLTPCMSLPSEDPELLYYQTCDLGFCKCYVTGKDPEFCSSPHSCTDKIGCTCGGKICLPTETCSDEGKCMCGTFECDEGETCVGTDSCQCGTAKDAPICDKDNGEICKDGKCYCNDIVCDSGYKCKSGKCTTYCDGIFCDLTETCVNNICLCVDTVCKDGEKCSRSGVGTTAPVKCTCGGRPACSSSQTCNREGVCVEKCGRSTCTLGEVCDNLECKCGKNVCKNGNTCNAKNHKCECGTLGKSCSTGQQCMSDPTAPQGYTCTGFGLEWWVWILIALAGVFVFFVLVSILSSR